MDTIEVNDFNNAQIQINVAKYNISIRNSPFFVAIETIPIPYNERYTQYIDIKKINGIPKAITFYWVEYQPSINTSLSKKMEEGWLLLLKPGSVWEKQIYVPAIKVIVN